MNNADGTEALLLQELEGLRQRVADLEAIMAGHQEVKDRLAHLASFPEQNPNLVIETDLHGRVTYLNPVAQKRFPELWETGFSHPLLAGVEAIIQDFRAGEQEYFAREIDLGDAVFEQKICCTRDTDLTGIRVFAHDITARRRAEMAAQQLTKQILSAQEEERRRVSRELHDEAGQALTALGISLQLLLADLPAGAQELRQNFVGALNLIGETKEHIRWLAWGLRPPALDTVGLNLTLEDYCRKFAGRTGLEVHYQGVDLPNSAEEINICLYRFLQEALTNVARHARANRVKVTLAVEEGAVQLSVADDGLGFHQAGDRPGTEQPSGIGLLGVQERIELLGGSMGIKSESSRGTCLIARLPWEPVP